jgi:hypothetical protein
VADELRDDAASPVSLWLRPETAQKGKQADLSPDLSNVGVGAFSEVQLRIGNRSSVRRVWNYFGFVDG